jgi:hypothetical protein
MKFSFGTSTLDPSANTTRTLNQIENDTSNSQIHGGPDNTVLVKSFSVVISRANDELIP